VVVMSLALKNLYSPQLDRLAYAIDAHETTGAAARFTRDWAQQNGAARALPPDWREALRQGRLAYVIALEAGMADALAALEPARSAVVRFTAEPGMEQGAFRTLEAELAGAVGELRAVVLQASLTGFTPKGDPSIRPFVASGKLGAEGSGEAGGSTPRPTAVQQNVPAWLVFGMFFVVTAVAGLLVQERRDGTLARLAGIGVPARIQVLAKALPYAAVNAAQAALMLAVGVFVMPLLGGEGLSLAGIDAWALLTVLLALSLAAIGFALLLACLVRTPAQANTLGPVCNLLMAALGGIMVPTFVMPPAMQLLAACSPMNWGLEGLLTVLLRHGDVAEAAPWAGRLAAFGALALAAAGKLFPRTVSS